MAGLHFPITGDNTSFINSVREIKAEVEKTSKAIEKSGMSIEDVFDKGKRAIAAMGAAMSAQQFAQKVLEIRGQFQQLEVAFTTMLGSAEKANTLMQQLTKTAAITPLGLQDVAGGAKQLLAYGIEAEKVNDTLIRLGDIAAGLSIPLGDLVYLYGTTMTQGRMFTMDLRQFMGRGIPIAEELAKIFGVAKDEVAGLVTAGKVTSVEFTKAIENMTNSGSKFGGLMAEKSKTITGQISNIEDAIDVMFNEIGKSNEGVINSALSGVSYLVENYEKVGEAITIAITAYGAYKAALMTSIALEKAAAANTTILTLAQHSLAKALKATAAATIANPYVLLGAAVAALGYGVYKLVTYETEAEKAQKKLNEAIAQSTAEIESERSKLERLQGTLKGAKEGSKAYNDAKDELIKNFSKYNSTLEQEITSVGLTKKAYDELNKSIDETVRKRLYATHVSEIDKSFGEDYGKKLAKLQSKLYEVLGDSKGSEAYAKIYEKITNNEVFFDRNSLSGLSGLGDSLGGADYDKSINSIIKTIIKAKNERDKAIIMAQERFNVEDIGVAKMALEKAERELSEYKSINERNRGYSITEKVYDARVKELENTVKRAKEKLSKYDLKEDEGQPTEKPLTSSIKELRKHAIAEYNRLLKAKEDYLKSDEKLTEKEQKTKLENLNEEIKIAKEKAELYGADFSKKGTKEQDKSAKELLDIQRKNQQDEIDLMKEGTEKKLAQIDLDYKRQIDAYNEAVKKYGMIGEVQAMKENADKEREQRTSEVYKERVKEMQDFLKENGANQSDIVKQNIDWSLVFGNLGTIAKSELQAQLSSLKEYIKGEEFKSLSAEDKETIMQSYNDLREQVGYTFDGIDFEALGEAINNAESKQKELNKAQEDYLKATKELKDAQEEYNDAIKNGTKEEINKADKNVKDKEGDVTSTKKNLDKASQEFSDAGKEVEESANNIVGGFKQAEEIIKDFSSNSLSGVFNGLKKLSDSLVTDKDGNKTEDGFMDKAMKNIGETLGLSLGGPIGEAVIGSIFSILDILKNGIENLIANLVDLILGAINGLLNSLLSLDMLKVVGGAIVDNVSSLLNTVTFGGFSSAVDSLNGGNADEVRETIERLTERNEYLIDAIDRLSDVMKDAKGGYESIKATERALELQREKEANLRDIAAAQMSYSGNHHSWNYYFEPGEKMMQEFERITGRTLKSSSDLLTLTAGQMQDFLASADVQEEIRDIGKSYYGSSVLEDLQAYADEAGAVQDLIDQLNEAIVGMSFDSFYDEFTNMLLDCEMSAEDFTENINKIFTEMLINQMVADSLKTELEKIYNNIAKIGENQSTNNRIIEEFESKGGTYQEAVNNYNALLSGKTYQRMNNKIPENYILSERRVGLELEDYKAIIDAYTYNVEAELDDVRTRYETAAEKAIQEAELIKEITGYDDYAKQEASSKGFQSMSQETGEELNGRFTALQITGESIKAQMIATVEGLNRIGVLAEGSNGFLSEMRNLAILQTGHLEDISKYTKNLISTNEILENIQRNTSRI